MRIRKTVSKLLGSAMGYPSHHVPPPPDLWAPPSMDDPGFDVCQLNQSPWDVYPNLHLFNNEFQDLEQSIISKKEEEEVEIKEENHKVISENTGEFSENTGTISEISDDPIPFCQKPTSKASKKKKEKRKKEYAIIPCKKNDGKKWFCKNPAQLPHSLCEYHLSQSRSYYNTSKEKEASQYHVVCEATKRKQKTRANDDNSANPYYYYNGFGPSNRKRRSGMSDDGSGNDIMHVADEERLDGCDALDKRVVEVYNDEIAGEIVSDQNEEEKQVPKKRGRKPDLEPSIILKKEEAEVETKEDTQKVISENTGAIVKNTDNPIRFCQKPTTKSPRKKKEKRKKKNDIIVLCKKNDGKKWFCKRSVRHPHSLCEYHLSQSRSYYNTNKEKDISQDLVDCEPSKQKHKPREYGGSGASPYYYFNGFGSSSRKRRNSISNGGGDHDTMHVAHAERPDVCDASKTRLELDEEYDQEEIAGERVSDPNEEEKWVPRKRGRKPVKCRSLKSLL